GRRRRSAPTSLTLSSFSLNGSKVREYYRSGRPAQTGRGAHFNRCLGPAVGTGLVATAAPPTRHNCAGWVANGNGGASRPRHGPSRKVFSKNISLCERYYKTGRSRERGA